MTFYLLSILILPLCAFAAQGELTPGVAEGEALVKEIAASQARVIGAGDAQLARQMTQAELVTAIPSYHLLSILKQGFKTYHETQTTAGDFDSATRFKVESLISGLKVDQEFIESGAGKVLPIYSYVIFPGDERVSLYEYGNVFVVFKNGVKARATWTPYDSFNLKPRGSRDDLFREGRLNTFSMARPVSEKMGRYREAQIWGGVSANDIAEVVVPNKLHTESIFYPYLEKMLGECVKMGIPVSVYIPDDANKLKSFRERVPQPMGKPPAVEIIDDGKVKVLYQDLYDRERNEIVEKYIRPFLPEENPADCAVKYGKTAG